MQFATESFLDSHDQAAIAGTGGLNFNQQVLRTGLNDPEPLELNSCITKIFKQIHEELSVIEPSVRRDDLIVDPAPNGPENR